MRKLAREVAWAKNSLVREHGWSPVALVFGREPRVFGELHQGGNPVMYHPSVGDAGSDVAVRMRYRYHAKMEFVISQARQMLLRTAQNRTRKIPVPKIGQLVFFWRAENSKKRDSQSKWVGPGYVVGVQDRNAWVACGGRCFLVAGESPGNIFERPSETSNIMVILTYRNLWLCLRESLAKPHLRIS